MLDRVYNKNNPFYKDYGDRGITVCDRWRFGEDGKSGFECFYEDMGPKPNPKLTLERRGNNDNYDPSNCYWGTPQEQANNTRRNVFITVNGETRTLAQWSRAIGYERHGFDRRVRAMHRLRARIAAAIIKGADAASTRKLGAELARKGRSLIHDLDQRSMSR